MSISNVVGLVGSLALLVTGMRIAAEAAGNAIGSALRADLGRWTRTRRTAFGTGLAGGALLPADEPRTRVLAGLAGGNRLQGPRATWVLLGGSAGGALVVWLALAFGRGELLRLGSLLGLAAGCAIHAAVQGPRRAWGTALAGASLAAFGLHVAGAELGSWGRSTGYPGLDVALPVRVLLGLVCGAGLAALLRSSALAAAVVVLGASAGLLHPASALSWLVGVPLGGALTAVQLWRRSEGEARRLAAAALVQAGAASLATLVVLLTTTPWLGHMPGAFRDAGVVAGLAYTASLGFVVLTWMALDRLLIDWIAGRVPDTHDVEADPGRDLETVPELLRSELIDVVQRGSSAVRGLARDVLSGPGVTEFRASEERAAAAAMVHYVEHAANHLAGRALAPELAATPVELPSAARAQLRICEGLLAFRTQHALGELPLSSPLVARIRQIQLAVLHLIEGSDPRHRRFSPRELRGEQETVHRQVRDVRGRLVGEATRGALHPQALEELLERLESLRDLGDGAAESGRALGRALEAATVTQPAPRTSGAATAAPEELDGVPAPTPSPVAAESGPPAVAAPGLGHGVPDAWVDPDDTRVG